MNEEYDDIIDLPHFEPRWHVRMPVAERAAQFAPFAALTGFGDAIENTANDFDSTYESDVEQKR